MIDVLLDALIDSLKVLGVTFILYIILSFFEDKLVDVLKKHKKTSPILGSAIGLIPQCGISVVASDLYLKEHITMGTIFAVFFACCDEALPILFASGEKALYAIPLLILKFVLGFTFGYLIDLFIKKELVQEELEDVHVGCCHHEIDHEESKIKEHLLHPLIHSLKIFAYVLIVNIIFGTIVFLVGEDNILTFLNQATYVTPIVAAMVGLIPNCASSVLLTELFTLGGLPFGALFTGLCCNAGLGLIYMLKRRKNWKDILLIIGLLLLTSIISGYAIIGTMNLIG